MKGQQLHIKDLPSFASDAPFVLYKLYNQVHWNSIIRKLTMILENVRNAESRDDNLEDKYESYPIPLMTFLKNVPKL